MFVSIRFRIFLLVYWFLIFWYDIDLIDDRLLGEFVGRYL